MYSYLISKIHIQVTYISTRGKRVVYCLLIAVVWPVGPMLLLLLLARRVLYNQRGLQWWNCCFVLESNCQARLHYGRQGCLRNENENIRLSKREWLNEWSRLLKKLNGQKNALLYHENAWKSCITVLFLPFSAWLRYIYMSHHSSQRNSTIHLEPQRAVFNWNPSKKSLWSKCCTQLQQSGVSTTSTT